MEDGAGRVGGEKGHMLKICLHCATLRKSEVILRAKGSIRALSREMA